MQKALLHATPLLIFATFAFTISAQSPVGSPFEREFSFENFDDDAIIMLQSETGTLVEIDNPDPNDINASTRCGDYSRNSAEQYDAIIYDLNDTWTAFGYASDEKRFFIDIYTDAPVGTEILLQLEKSADALPDNYPTGRHSRFQAFTTTTNEWERLQFVYFDRPDETVVNSQVDRLVFLFAPNTFTDHQFLWDNFDSYEDNTSSTRHFSKDDLAVDIYPNPATSEVYVRNASEYSWETIQIFNTSGQLIDTRRVNLTSGETIDLDISTLTSGKFYLTISGERTKIRRAFIKY